MENLDLIIATSIAVILFGIFIAATWIEFNKMGRGELNTGKDKSSVRTDL